MTVSVRAPQPQETMQHHAAGEFLDHDGPQFPPEVEDSPLAALPEDHLAAPQAPDDAGRARSALILACVLAIHALIVAILVYEASRENMQTAALEEIPVELVQEPPPEPAPPPPPPPEPPPPPKEKAQKQPKPKIDDDARIATDAPRFENKEKVERVAPDQETKAQAKAEPSKQTAQTPAPPKPPEAPADADKQGPAEDAPAKPAEDKPGAEALDKATPAPPKRAVEKKAPAPSKAPPTQAKRQTLSDQLASLAPVPDYKVGSSAKPSPVGGGTAPTSYLSILYGLIMPHMKIPADLRDGRQAADGIVAFYVDERGNLTHQVVYRASGRPDLDRAAMAAVKAAAPFPPPPRGDPHSIWFHYDTR